MTRKPADILRLIRKGESETVEFKKSFGRETLETLCANPGYMLAPPTSILAK